MPFKGFTRYYRDPAFKARIDEIIAYSDAETKPGEWITYTIHDPSKPDHIWNSVHGLAIYVGQTKEFRKRVRKRLSNAGRAVKRPKDRIDGACYDIMARGYAPVFRVIDRQTSMIDSLISETNWAKKLKAKGYPLLNQWTEQKFSGKLLTRAEVPHAWLWPRTAEDAIGSAISLIVRDESSGDEHEVDLTTFPPNTLLREIRDLVKANGRTVRIFVCEKV